MGGQMSFWGATVITNLLSPFPCLIEWICGGFYISNPTLKRFFIFHFVPKLENEKENAAPTTGPASRTSSFGRGGSTRMQNEPTWRCQFESGWPRAKPGFICIITFIFRLL